MPDKIYTLDLPPGIQKDGTQFASPCWTASLWTRFQRGLPRKIGGCKEIAQVNGFVRGVYVVPNSPNFIIFYATQSHLYALPIDGDLNVLGPPVDRTPANFPVSAFNEWQFSTMYSAPDQETVLLAFCTQNLSSIANPLIRPVYYGPLTANTPLISNNHSISGGIVMLYPFLFTYGNNGFVNWYAPNNPTIVSGSASIAGDKIVAALPVRGGTSSPAGLFWSLTSVVRATFTGNINDEFNFDIISSESSILSSNCVIEYDNIYYWLGVDRFLLYNGTVQELPNDKNINFFFDNLNYDQRQKVWVTKITRFGEIWWHYPMGTAVECNAALIYNVRERSWYNTAFDSGDVDGRSSGYFDTTFAYPVWSGNLLDDQFNFPLYVHEYGTDKVFVDGTVEAIESGFTTSSLSYCATMPNGSQSDTNINMFISRIEPDFIMSGTMTLNIFAKEFAQVTETLIGTGTFTSNTNKLDFTAMGREIYLQFLCTDVGCDYQMGKILIVGKLGDMRS